MRPFGATFGNSHIEPEDFRPAKKSPWPKELTHHMLSALSKLDSEWRTGDEIKISQNTLRSLVMRGLAERRGIYNGGSTSHGRQSPLARLDNEYRLTKKGEKMKKENNHAT